MLVKIGKELHQCCIGIFSAIIQYWGIEFVLSLLTESKLLSALVTKVTQFTCYMQSVTWMWWLGSISPVHTQLGVTWTNIIHFIFILFISLHRRHNCHAAFYQPLQRTITVQECSYIGLSFIFHYIGDALQLLPSASLVEFCFSIPESIQDYS